MIYYLFGLHSMIGVVYRGVSPKPLIMDIIFFQNGINIWHLLYTVINNHLKIRLALILFKLHEIW